MSIINSKPDYCYKIYEVNVIIFGIKTHKYLPKKRLRCYATPNLSEKLQFHDALIVKNI